MIIGSNFRLNSRKFLDARQQCESLEKLNANEEGILYPYGFEVFCVEEGKWYQNVSEDNTPIWEQRKGGVGGSNGEINIDDIIEDGEVLSDKTWSSEYINGFKINLEQSIIDTEDYVTEIEDRVIYIEGQLQWFETFDGSYNSLTDKPIIPSKISDLENDSNFITIDVVSEVIDALHTHENLEILNGITEEKISLWDNMADGVFNGDYNFLENKPIEYIGDDNEIKLNLNNVTSGNYIITNAIDDMQLVNELVVIDKKENELLIVIPKLLIKIIYILNNGEWVKQEKINYQIDKDNANISNSLNIGTNNIVGENNQIVQGKYNVEDTEGKYINIVGNGEDEENRRNIHTLDWEGNAWYNGKVSQEGIPTEDKDLVTKGYVDGKFATSERVEKYIEDNDKENARRDVIIDALANGRRRTIDYVDGEADLFYATEKDSIFIDKIEGETLVNVCDQEEPITITKSYTVENTNHVALQGEYDGKCRPVVYGNTLVNRNVEYDKSMVIGNTINENGTEVNINGTVNSEVEVSLDGHTALNLGTKKDGGLCKSFESASGNVKLTTDRNSKTDVVCQGNTLVNLCNNKSTGNNIGIRTYNFNQDLKGRKVTIQINMGDLDTTYMEWAIYRRKGSANAGSFITYTNNFSIKVVDFSTDAVTDFDKYVLFIRNYNGSEYIDFDYTKIKVNVFEGDLTQTSGLIPTECINGIQSTFEDKYIPYSIYNGDNLTSITETQYQLPLTVKTNTEYTIVTTINTTKYQYAIYSQDSLSEYLAYENTLSTATFSSDKANISFKVRMNPSYEGDDYSFVLDEVKDKFLIVEGNWQGRENLLTSEYFGKYKVDMSSVGKNLFDINKKPRYSNRTENIIVDGESITFIATNAYASLYYDISVKIGKTYTFSYESESNSACKILIYNDKVTGHTSDKMITQMGGSSLSKSFVADTETVCIRFSTETLSSGSYTWVKPQLEEGDTATEYEPYYGTTKTVYLNSPLYEGDELLTKDGKIYHYHKMRSTVLDGSENWGLSTNTTSVDESLLRFDVPLKFPSFLMGDGNDGSYHPIYCDIFPSLYIHGTRVEINRKFETISLHSTGNSLSILIQKSKLSTTDLNGFIQWLSEHPTTIVYELANPYYEEISITDDMIFDIATSSTLSYESAVPMGTTSFFPYTNELPLLETSTQYRVSFDCDVVGLPLVISLGGTTTTITTSELHNTLSIITPSIETNGKLTIDGSGMVNIDNVVVTKGEMVYEYFEGLKSSFEKEINLFNKENAIIKTGYLVGNSSNTAKPLGTIEKNSSYKRVFDLSNIKFKPNTTYTINFGSYTSNKRLSLISNDIPNLLVDDITDTYITFTTPSNMNNSYYILQCYKDNNIIEGITATGSTNGTADTDINYYFLNVLKIQEGNIEEMNKYMDKYKVNLTLTINDDNLIFGKGGRL